MTFDEAGFALIGVVAALVVGGCGGDGGSGGEPARPDAGRPVGVANGGAGVPGDGGTAGEGAGSESDPERDADLVEVRIEGEVFRLEPALDDATRFRGLGGRASLHERGGMVFAFPFSQRLEFVMRDCLIDIDIAYLNNTGRVLAMHTMPVEPREPGESDEAYEARLARYSSRYPARFAVEVRGGLLRELGLEVGDVIEFDHEGLKERAR